ncbi:sigma-70 family RNA polymerase sigma factor [Spirillospora sp. NPDC048911]|uniref:sigma-70 family RNA polymerase sigma factor n=1 Tax=Spirillospora sp. NPDC048911 TaxID=3364527 RepID=UPI003710F738
MGEAASDMALEESSDAVLIARIRAGDASAYGTLYERHREAARKLAGSLVEGDRAEDAVQDTFTKILDVLSRGGGPRSDFRPYLLTAVRRTVYDRHRAEKRLRPTGRIELYDPGMPVTDPALERLERTMIVRAYRSLPERWRAVLWHTEVEGAKPADIAPLLGLTANGVAALAYRAREGLRQAYLQMHLAEPSDAGLALVGTEAADDQCRPALGKLGSYVRGGLARRDTRAVEHHLDECERCQGIYFELADVNTTLREALGPLILGAAVTGYLGMAAKGGIAAEVLDWFHHLPKRQQQVLGSGMAALGVAVVSGFVLVSDKPPPEPVRQPSPVAQASASVAPKQKPPLPLPPKPAARSLKPASPARQPLVPLPLPARLTARIATVGALVRQQSGIVAMSVANYGIGTSQSVIANVDLPPGVTYAGAVTGPNAVFKPRRPPGNNWSCRPAGVGSAGQAVAPAAQRALSNQVRCTHGPLSAGVSSSAYLRVVVAGNAPFNAAPQVTLRAGGVGASARAAGGVVAGGMPARFAADGNLRVVQVGNALLSCDEGQERCAGALHRQGDRRDNDLWEMAPSDLDQDRSTRTSSAARLELPAGGTVRWAGLYWSGVGLGGPARLRPPGGAYQQVRPAAIQRGRLPHFGVYQAFADVTAIVRRNGGGRWWGADVPTSPGASRYAGWSLVVVVSDPKAPYQQAMVLDGARSLGPHTSSRVDVPVNGLLTTTELAKIGLVLWEGDADLTGDRLLLDGRPLAPAGGDRSARNIADGSANGAIDTELTFGIDVDNFAAPLHSGGTLSLTTRRDAYLAGVVTVTAPKRS